MKLKDTMVSAVCWCSRTEVEIPVSWVMDGNTQSCSYLGCGPGCEMVQDDEDPYDEPIAVPEPRKVKMNKFNPDRYDPTGDSTRGLPTRPNAISLLVGDGMCGCGCGDAPTGAKAKFLMGHDARLKGKLSRALAARMQVALVEETTGAVSELEPLEYAARFSTAKVDWQVLIQASADKVLSRRGKVDRRSAERRVLERAANDGAVRIGRWDKTDSVAAIYQLEGGEYEVEYVDEAGAIRQTKVQVA